MERKSPNKDTSWHGVASWYDELLQGADTYQSKVIAPNLLRMMDLSSTDRIADLACGQGFFSGLFAEVGAQVTGVDLGKDLIEIAKKNNPRVAFHVASLDKMPMLKDGEFNKAIIVLALQNIKPVKESLQEVSRILDKGGKLYVVLNHPAFRIPGSSSWGFEGDKQYRRIDAYMSEKEIAIDMHPGQKDSAKTVSFHRPLQWYMKHAASAGFAITRLEEWISHKESQEGPKKAEEDRVRKEFPMFLAMEFKKL